MLGVHERVVAKAPKEQRRQTNQAHMCLLAPAVVTRVNAAQIRNATFYCG